MTTEETAIQEKKSPVDFSLEGQIKIFKQHRREEIKIALEKKYENENKELQDMANFILTFMPNEFHEVKNFAFRIFFVKHPPKKDSGEMAGLCKRLPDDVRFKLEVDYFILIWKEAWDNYSNAERAKLLIHEFHHMREDDKGLPAIRRHNEEEDYCELPSHDAYSDNIFLKIRDKLAKEKSLP
jgi:hypothetical protein